MKGWLWLPQPRPDAYLRLYCLAHAGGGASAFAGWTSACPYNIELAAVQLPGRESRLNEEPLRHFSEMARPIGEVISADSRPFAIFGHSAGGKLAIHVSSYLQDIGRCPLRVFLSGAPTTVPRSCFLHQLGKDQFIRAVCDRFGPLPAEIIDDPDVWSVFERPLRADLEAHETDDTPPRRLRVPLSVISGNRDHVVDSLEQRHWQAWSLFPVRYEAVDADHFSYRRQAKIYLDVIVRHLESSSFL